MIMTYNFKHKFWMLLDAVEFQHSLCSIIGLICSLFIYVVIFLFPSINSIYDPYYSIISLHRNTKYVSHFLQVGFLWYVYIFNCRLNKIIWNSFNISTILRILFSVTVYCVWGPVSLWIYNQMGLPLWLITSPSW